MATNKHATIRYHALDRCFGNFGRKFFIEHLIEECNEAIYDFDGIKDGVKRRQIYDDITFMESDQGWAIPLERHKDGRRVYYRYAHKSFSITNKGINPSEAEQLRDTLSILSRFKGMPQLEWIEETQIRLEDTFKLKGDKTSSVSYEQNPYLVGLNHFTELFNAIQNQQALEIAYQGFRQDTISNNVIHPWYLKQYNNRWFLFGYNNTYQSLSNLAIDRIVSIDQSNEPYIENREINFEEYFEDVVGISVHADKDTEKVLLKININSWPYIKSKPLHGSQKVIDETECEVIVGLDVQLNHELIALLFSYMNGIEVLQPTVLRDKFKAISEAIYRKYS